MRLFRLLLLACALGAPLPAFAQTTLSVQTLPTEFDGAASITFTAAASSMTFLNDGRTFLWVKNASASPVTVTAVAVRPSDDGITTDATYTIAAGKLGIIEALSIYRFNALATGLATIQLSATTSVEVAAVRMPTARR